MRLDTKNGRSRIDPRPAPYYVKIGTGRFIGYRKTNDGNETWCARFRDEDGRQHYCSLGSVSHEADYDKAASAADAWFRQLQQGVTGKTETGAVVTIETACREYVEDRRRRKGAMSASYTARFFERQVYGRARASRKKEVKADPIARIPLARLRKKHLEEWRDRRLGDGREKSTMNRELTDLRAALNLAVKNRHVSKTQELEWQDVEPFKNADNRRELYLDRTERRALLAACQGAVRDLVEAAMLSGARAGELTSARVSQFNARTQSMTFTGKTGTRTVPVSPSVVQLFKRLSRSKLPSAYLLTRDDGQPWDHSGWDEAIHDAAKKAKLPAGTCLYTLRHSFVTQVLSDGMPTLEVSKIVGASLRMIEKHYGHFVIGAARTRLAQLEMV